MHERDIEIPFEQDRHGHYRFFEILPGALSWLLLLLPLILSFINVTLAAFFILAYTLTVFTRFIGVDIRAILGHRIFRQQVKLDWNELIQDLENEIPTEKSIDRPKWHLANLLRLHKNGYKVKPHELYHAFIIATYNESIAILEPTFESIISSEYNLKKVIVILAYEERGGETTEKLAKEIIKKYEHYFYYAAAIKHPRNIPGEIIGKGGNITNAGRYLKSYLETQDIDPYYVVVTTLDADNRPHRKYLSALSYLYCVVPDPLRASYQPLAMFTNNIWDAPAPMRVVATGNSFFYIVLTQRPHLERNFSAHAQSMRALIDMDFWSVRTIVEDGHHFWRSYFFYDGNYRVYPFSIPIYQDAVLSDTFLKTLKAQFIQLRRWTYGASDIAYIANQGFYKPNKVPKLELIAKFFRTLENHVTWATGALLLAFAAFIPALIHPNSYAANELPLIISRIQTIGLIGALASLYVSIRTLPPRPARYKRRRTFFMIVQWVYLPVTTIVYGSLAAIYSQSRLMLRRYVSKFDVTDKTVVTDKNEKISTPINS